MISVTDLTSYIYCPRKLFLKLVMKYKEPPKNVTVLGILKHEMFDRINKNEELIVTSINKPMPTEEIEILCRKNYADMLIGTLRNMKRQILSVNLSPPEVFNETWDFFLEEAELRAINLSNFIDENNLFGKDLWEALIPKILSEVKIVSEKLGLVGRLDKIEIENENYRPVDLKTGSPPKSDIWQDQKIQLSAYALLIEEKFDTNVDYGYIEYLKTREKRRLYINPFMKENVKILINEVNNLIKANKLPDKIENINKCNYCGLRAECYKLN